ncbi:MAG: hypothetical protein U0559_01470 [Anaerolineae bacterium]
MPRGFCDGGRARDHTVRRRTPQMAIDATREMYEIAFGEHEGFTIPILTFAAQLPGIDVRKVMETGILPRLNTGIAHKKPGVGMVGGHLASARTMLKEAFEALKAQC